MRGGFLEVLEDGEVAAEVHAVGAFDAALKAAEGLKGVPTGVAEGGIVLDGLVEVLGVSKVVVEAFDLILPELSFDATEAALGPLGGDEVSTSARWLGSAGRWWSRNSAVRAWSSPGSSPRMT